MTRLLVSVRDADEARKAVDAGAALIDVKEPARGSLGAADPVVWQAVLAAVAERVPVSAALGELLHDEPLSAAPFTDGLHYAKVGLADCANRRDWVPRWNAVWKQLPPTVTPVAVIYADHEAARAPSPLEVLHHAARAGCGAILFDTYHKSEGDLFSQLPEQEVLAISAAARAHGMFVVLAGSLNQSSLPRAARLEPEYVAVRGAVCRGTRQGELDSTLVRQLVLSLSTHQIVA